MDKQGYWKQAAAPQRTVQQLDTIPDVQETTTTDPCMEIRTIWGGPSCGDSGRARKAYKRGRTGSTVFTVQNASPTPIHFGPEDVVGVATPHEDALVITATIGNAKVHRLLVDNGSSADILYWGAFEKMGIAKE